MNARSKKKSIAIVATGLMSATMLTPIPAMALDVITVTARKKAETLQEAPIAVSVVTADQLDNLILQDLSDISKVTAGLQFDAEFGRDSNRPVIRGQANILGASGVSYFIDGVLITGAIDDYDINDVERIEVVKGPQSALYGRNTYSGAINIITKSPGDELSGRIQVEAAEDEQYEISGSLKGPIIPGVLSAGITGRYYDFGGEYENAFDGSKVGEQQSTSVSGVVVYTPMERLEVRARAYYAELEDGQAALFHSDASENNCFFDNGSLYGGDGRYFCGVLEPRDVNTDYLDQIGPDTGLFIDRLQASLSIDYDISDNLTLTSITGYNRNETRTLTDGDYQPTSFQTAVFTPGGFPISGFPFPPFGYGYVGSIVDFTFASEDEVEDYSQELRLAFETDRVTGLVGAYYFKQTNDSQDIRTLPDGAQDAINANYFAALAEQQTICGFNPICSSISPLFGPVLAIPRDTNELEIENTAIFGLLNFDITSELELTLEGRYQEEEISQSAIARDEGDPIPAPVVADAKFNSFNPRVTLDYALSDDNHIYALAARGNKPGGFNGTVAIEAGLPTFDEETVWAYEIGSKNVFADGQIIANFAAYFNQVEGYQLTQNARSGANTTSATVNAGDADILGFEAEILAQPADIDGLTLTFNYAFTDAEFTEGFDENQGVLNDVAVDGDASNCSFGDQFDPSVVPSSVAGVADPNCDTPAFGSIKGKKIPRTARNQAFIDVDYRRPLNGTEWEWFGGANVSYESSKFAQVHNLAKTGSATLVGARLGVGNDRYTLRLWGKNLLDEDSTPLVLRYADGADSFKRSFVGNLRRGRHVGVTATANF